MNLIKYKNKNYPKFQTEGFSAQYCFPFATKFCQGNGLDIGCSKKEWALPNAMPIDITFEDDYDALNLPDGSYDYIFSSHCLEHILDWPSVLSQLLFNNDISKFLAKRFRLLDIKIKRRWHTVFIPARLFTGVLETLEL